MYGKICTGRYHDLRSYHKSTHINPLSISGTAYYSIGYSVQCHLASLASIRELEPSQKDDTRRHVIHISSVFGWCVRFGSVKSGWVVRAHLSHPKKLRMSSDELDTLPRPAPAPFSSPSSPFSRNALPPPSRGREGFTTPSLGRATLPHAHAHAQLAHLISCSVTRTIDYKSS